LADEVDAVVLSDSLVRGVLSVQKKKKGRGILTFMELDLPSCFLREEFLGIKYDI
jgi:hypothetical protein